MLFIKTETGNERGFMKAFLKGLLFAVMGGALGPVVNAVAHGNFSPVALGTSAAMGAALTVGAYLHPSPNQQNAQGN